MNNIGKALCAILSCLIIMGIMTSRTKMVTNEWAEDELTYALRVATQDATSVLMDENHTLDGNTDDMENIQVDLQRSLNQFQSSFHHNVGSYLNEVDITNMNIPLVGYVGYRYITGQLYDGSATMPFAYSYVKDGNVYNFTLGDTVYRLNDTDETEFNLKTMSEHFFNAEQTNLQFRDFVVMSAISKYLTIYNTKDYSIVAQNAGSGLTFELGASDYAGDPSVMTEFSAVIDGPGFFAVTDMMHSQTTGVPVRTFTFGGSELVSKY